MKRNRNDRKGRPQLLAAVCVTALLVAGLSSTCAGDDSLKSDAKKAGHAVGSTARDIGHGAKQAGKDIGHGAKEAGKAIGGAAKEGGREFRRALKGQ